MPSFIWANFDSYSLASLNEADFANAEKLSKGENNSVFKKSMEIKKKN